MSSKPTAHLPKTLSLFRIPGRPRSFATTPASTRLRHPLSIYPFFSKALKFSAEMHLPLQGKQVHAQFVKLEPCNSLALQNQVLNVYIKCKEFTDANKLFDEMRVRNVVTWNTVICGLVGSGGDFDENLRMVFSYFRRMLMDRVRLDYITLNGLLRACIELNDVGVGRQLHCSVVKLGFEFYSFVSGGIVDLYGKCGLVEEARLVFDRVTCRDMVFWNVMLSCYALNGLAEEAFAVFNLLRHGNMLGDGFTFSSILNACGTLGSYALGRQIHGLVMKLCLGSDILVASGLVDMYARSGSIADSREVFNAMAARSVVSWNTMVVSYGQLGEWKEAMKLLQAMFREGFYPDDVTLASIVSSCGSASACSEIMHAHAYVVKVGFHSNLSVINALINAYSKCGRIYGALHCFDSVPGPDVVTWTSLICAYAYNSFPTHSIKTFEMMLSSGVRPDGISFLGVLSACSHAGLVTEGLHYFKLMTKGYQILPDLEHYICLVDLIGRAGLLDEAFDIVASIPVGDGSDTLGAFIGACKIHGDLKLAEWASEKLLDMGANKSASFTLMSNMYASQGHWSGVAKIRQTMRDNYDRKVPGCSWMEVADAMHTFAPCVKCCPEAV